MIVDMVRVENGFVKYRDTFPGGPAAYFADVTQPLFVAKNFILVFQTLVGDGVLVGSILPSARLKPSWLTDLYSLDKISIAVTSFGNLSGFLSYRACSGAPAHVRSFILRKPYALTLLQSDWYFGALQRFASDYQHHKHPCKAHLPVGDGILFLDACN
jgi:hypothetical protein